MVSVPSGAAGERRPKQLPLLQQGYDEIVLFYDNDEPGRQAAQACASVLPPGKVKIAHLQGDYKDASDALKPMTLTLYAKLSGTRNRSVLMALSMAKLF